jgi:putative DNA primase/helicase
MTLMQDNNPNPDGVAPSNGAESESQRKLSPEHLRVLLEESAIAPEVVSERGYFTATDPAELEELGFARTQRRVPALVIPVHGVNGECRFHRARPDDPREDADKPGKFTKYEQPLKTGVALDVPPQAQPALSDATKRLWLAEGEKKADALVSRGECALDVLGVWSWKRDGLPLPDWDEIRLVGREVFVAFDSDAERNAHVRLARSALASYLRGRGAKVRIVKLRDEEDGSKVGVDNFLAAGGTVDELLEAAEEFTGLESRDPE